MSTINKQNNKEIRCKKCDKLVAKITSPNHYEIKCTRCGTLNLVFEEMPEQVIITDGEGKIVYINKTVESVTGYSIQESIGKKPSELWGGSMDSAFYAQMWKQMLSDKKSINFSMTNKRKTGEMYNVDLIVSPIVDNTGKIIYFVGIEMIKKDS